MRIFTYPIKWILGAMLLLFAVAAQAKTAVFTILTFNDVYTITPDSSGRGGFAEMQTLLNQERAKSVHHITTVNGDFLSPSILSFFDKGAHRIELFNMLGIDVVGLGNHEFDFGPDEVLKRIKESDFPWLAANAIGLDGNPFTGNTQAMIFDVDGIRVGLFGLITVETPQLSSTEKKVCFSPLVYTAERMIQELKDQGAEVIVALTHLLMAEDRQLAAEVPAIDVILGGHDHDPITWYNDKTFIHKSGQNAYYLARIDLILEKKEGVDKVGVFPSWSVILNKDIPRDELVGAKVDKLQEVFHSITSAPIGVMGMECDSLYSNVRAKETKIGNLVTDALVYATGADLGMISGGIIRGNKFYEPGMELTLRDLLTELPFGNLIVSVEIPGSAILDALENGVSKVEGKAGRFLQVSGMEFVYDLDQPPGSRIYDVKVKGEALDAHRMYKVATVDYMFNGGDGYGMFKSGKILLSPLKAITLVSSLADYVKTMPYIKSELEGRIIVRSSSRTLDEVAELLN